MSGGEMPAERRTIGKYRLVRRIGGDDAVERYLAEHIAIGRTVEVRCLGPDAVAEGEAAAQLLREAKVLGGATHRNLQGVVDTGRDEAGCPYVVYESLRGETLAKLIAQHPHGLEPGRAARIVTQLLEALRSLHEAGAVLRTLTPEHVMVEPVSAGTDLAKIRATEGAALLNEAEPPSTPLRYTAWLAPELRRGDVGLDPRVDVYSVGVILRQLLTGTTAGDDEMLSDAARRAVARASAVLPEERFASADGFLQAVALILPSEARPVREQLPTPEDPLSADLQYLFLRRGTRRSPGPAPVEDESRLSLLVVLLTIEAIYRRFGAKVWADLTSRVTEAEALLPGSGNTPVHLEKGVGVLVFARILSVVDEVAGRGDLSLLPSLGEHVARRGLRKLVPDLPEGAGPDALLAGFPYLWSRIGRDGTAEVVRVGPTSVRIAVRGQRAATLEVAGLVAGLLREGMRMLGAQEVEVVLIAAEALGDGCDLYGVDWRAP